MKRVHVFLPFVCFFLVWLSFSYPYFFQGKTPFPARYLVSNFQPWQPYYGMASKNNAMPDVITQIYPWRHFSIESIKEGGWALWNPYSFSGTVHAGNYQSAPFFPLNILFFFLPFVHAWSLLVLLQPLCASIFMFLFLRSLNRSRAASFIGGISFMFCGFMTVWMAYATLGWAIVFLPLVFFGIEQIYKSISAKTSTSSKKTKRFLYLQNMYVLIHDIVSTASLRRPIWLYGCIISIALACSFLAGHFQMSLYVLLVCFAYTCFKGKKTVFITFPFFILGLLLAFPQIILAFDAFIHSNRSENYITNAGIPLQYLLTVFAPDFFGNPVTRNDWFGQYAEWSSYIGVIPIVFALAAGIFIPMKKNIFFFVLALVSLVLAVYSPVSQLFYQLRIPVFSTSVATRMIVFFSFSLIIFSSYGFDYITTSLLKVSIKKKLLYVLVPSFFVLLLWIGTVYVFNLTQDQQSIAHRNLVLPTLFFFSGLFLSFLLGIKRLKYTIVFIICLIIVFDMYRFVTKWMPFEERQYMFPTVAVLDYLQKNSNNNRVFSNIGNEMNTYFGIQSAEGYDAMYNARYGELISAAADGIIHPLGRSVVQFDRNGIYTKKWFDLLGIRYIVYRVSDGRNVWVFPHWNYPDIVSVYKDEHYEILENKSAVPKAYFAFSYKEDSNPNSIIRSLTELERPYTKEVILEKQISAAIEESISSAEILTYKPHEITIKVHTSTPQILVLADAYDTNWNAYIDNKKTEVLRVNYALRGVIVPPDASQVVFRYQPVSSYIGFAALLFSSVIVIAGSVSQLLYDSRFL